MRHLFVVLNGVYDFEKERLTDRSRNDAMRLAGEMKYVCGEMRRGMFVMTSPARHARETAEIIASAFGAQLKEYEILVPDGDEPSLTDLGIINRFVGEHKRHNAVSIVTGIDIAMPYSQYFLKRYLDRKDKLQDLRQGEAFHFDKRSRTYECLPELN